MDTFKKIWSVVLYMIIGILIFIVFIQDRDHKSFIEQRRQSFKEFQDSVNLQNTLLYDSLRWSREEVDSLSTANDSIMGKIYSIDSSLTEIDKKLKDEIHIIDNSDIDSNISILSRFLSKEDSI